MTVEHSLQFFIMLHKYSKMFMLNVVLCVIPTFVMVIKPSEYIDAEIITKEEQYKLLKSF